MFYLARPYPKLRWLCHISVVFDRNELIWFSTSTGLVVYNHLTNWYKLFNADNGLLVNTFGNIFEDDDGNKMELETTEVEKDLGIMITAQVEAAVNRASWILGRIRKTFLNLF